MLLFALLACVKQPPGDSARPGETGDSRPGDTGGKETGGELPPIGPCGAWSGVRRVGTRWSVRATESYTERLGWTGEGVIEVTADNADATVLHYVARFEGESGWFELDRTETWRCDEAGAWWLRSDVTTTGRSGNADIGVVATRTFDPGWRVRPGDVEPRATWEDRFVVTNTIDGGEPTEEEVVCNSTLGPAEARTVPAGSFTASLLAVTCDRIGAASPWLSSGTGFVDDGDVELVDYVP